MEKERAKDWHLLLSAKILPRSLQVGERKTYLQSLLSGLKRAGCPSPASHPPCGGESKRSAFWEAQLPGVKTLPLGGEGKMPLPPGTSKAQVGGGARRRRGPAHEVTSHSGLRALPAPSRLKPILCCQEKGRLPGVAENYTLTALQISSSFKCWLWPKTSLKGHPPFLFHSVYIL